MNVRAVNEPKALGLTRGLAALAFALVIALMAGCLGAFAGVGTAYAAPAQSEVGAEEGPFDLAPHDPLHTPGYVDGTMLAGAGGLQAQGLEANLVAAAEAVMEGARTYEEYVSVKDMWIPYSQETLTAIRDYIVDTPEFFFMHNTGCSTVLVDGVKYISKIYPRYRYETNEQRDAARAALEEGALGALSWAGHSMTDVQKAKAMHDYLVRTCAYEELPYDEATNEPHFSHTALGALTMNKAVCQGYALAYKMLMLRLGIPCVYVVSLDMNHAWNMVKIDGDWYHVDVTWDDPLIQKASGELVDGGFDYVRHKFFLKSDETMMNTPEEAERHYGWASDYESLSGDYPFNEADVYAGPAEDSVLGPVPEPDPEPGDGEGDDDGQPGDGDQGAGEGTGESGEEGDDQPGDGDGGEGTGEGSGGESGDQSGDGEGADGGDQSGTDEGDGGDGDGQPGDGDGDQGTGEGSDGDNTGEGDGDQGTGEGDGSDTGDQGGSDGDGDGTGEGAGNEGEDTGESGDQSGDGDGNDQPGEGSDGDGDNQPGDGDGDGDDQPGDNEGSGSDNNDQGGDQSGTDEGDGQPGDGNDQSGAGDEGNDQPGEGDDDGDGNNGGPGGDDDEVLPDVDPNPNPDPIPLTFTTASFKLSYASCTYSGTAKTPKVSAVFVDGLPVSPDEYTVMYANNKSVGTALVTVSFARYSGFVSKTFKINPKGTSISSLTKGPKSLKVVWKKQATKTTGYQVQYSLKKSMASAKTVTVKGAKATSKTIKKLRSKKRYYVRVRTYKTVGTTKYYSGWSTKKSVVVK